MPRIGDNSYGDNSATANGELLADVGIGRNHRRWIYPAAMDVSGLLALKGLRARWSGRSRAMWAAARTTLMAVYTKVANEVQA